MMKHARVLTGMRRCGHMVRSLRRSQFRNIAVYSGAAFVTMSTRFKRTLKCVVRYWSKLVLAAWLRALNAKYRGDKRFVVCLPIFFFLGCYRAQFLPCKLRHSFRYNPMLPAASTVRRYHRVLLSMSGFEARVMVPHLECCWPRMAECLRYELLAHAERMRNSLC